MGTVAAGAHPWVPEIPAEGLSLEVLERELILKALDMARGNKSQAARLLDLTRRTLYSRMERHGLRKPGEGEEGADAHPACEELAIGVALEAADIRADEGLAGEAHVEDHGDGPGQVLPRAGVVAGPGRGAAVAADEVGAGEDEGALVGAGAGDTLAGGADHEHAVDVVVAPVRRGTAEGGIGAVDVVLGHLLLGVVEDGGFVHVVPHAIDARGDKLAVEPRPPLTRPSPREVGEHAVTGPHFTHKVLAIPRLDVMIAREPRGDRNRAVTDHQPPYLERACAERQAQADFAASLADREGDDAVESEARERKSGCRESAEQKQVESPLRDQRVDDVIKRAD